MNPTDDDNGDRRGPQTMCLSAHSLHYVLS